MLLSLSASQLLVDLLQRLFLDDDPLRDGKTFYTVRVLVKDYSHNEVKKRRHISKVATPPSPLSQPRAFLPSSSSQKQGCPLASSPETTSRGAPGPDREQVHK